MAGSLEEEGEKGRGETVRSPQHLPEAGGPIDAIFSASTRSYTNFASTNQPTNQPTNAMESAVMGGVIGLRNIERGSRELM